MRRFAVCTLLTGLLITFESAQGFGGRGGSMWGTRSTPIMMYPTWGIPAYAWTPCYPVVTPHVAPLTSKPIPFAPPRSAPPSRETTEPPLGKTTSHANPDKRGPEIVESRSSSATQLAEKDRCRVGFWNLTGKDVEINVGGKMHTLAKDRALTLELARTFNWNIEGQAPSQEKVAPDRVFHEIILRAQ